ncbi:unnamed protein product (macronuclear) [Paramecium tetraurelia]|uniref:Protein kinase domain-containing protein n=1 Tax=Paramecium tetraurelia TaxID=5888 RepID=A0D9Z7_PARTE|nr:uncharacterized protein GSPATT00014796001 [Paramecium tetraurelia]CAK79864.1 unnamed protein product [Paramecium tetraurelia]|eukprot:XP_001447261.1 hypothetical protein (macronuclear) [Paramecium tetraurelia strain d4-2]
MGNKQFQESFSKSKSDTRPLDVKKCISIRRDPITGKLIGVPKEWATHLDADEQQIVETNKLPEEVRTHRLPERVLEIQNSIENQKNLKQGLKIDKGANLGLAGLNVEMEKEIYNSGVSRNEIVKDTVSFISILEIYDGKELASKQNSNEVMTQTEFLIENPAQKYIFYEQIERGVNCKLYKIIDRRLNQVFVAKVFKFYDNFNCYRLKREISFTRQLECPFIVKYHETYLHSGCFFIIQEHMNFGSLRKFIKLFDKKIDESIIGYILYQILLGLKYLHFKGKIHKHLSSKKVLMNDKGDIKLLIMDYKNEFKKDKDPYWIAPEIIEQQIIEDVSDIWCLGIIAYELSERNPPHFDDHPIRVMYNIVNQPAPKISKNRSCNFQDFTSKCLIKNYNKRTSLRELLRHDFITQNRERGRQGLIDLFQKVNLDQKSKLKKSASLK